MVNAAIQTQLYVTNLATGGTLDQNATDDSVEANLDIDYTSTALLDAASLSLISTSQLKPTTTMSLTLTFSHTLPALPTTSCRKF
jgi:hypothetical protein